MRVRRIKMCIRDSTCNHYGVDECNIWGDYFYMEALMRLHKDWQVYW